MCLRMLGREVSGFGERRCRVIQSLKVVFGNAEIIEHFKGVRPKLPDAFEILRRDLVLLGPGKRHGQHEKEPRILRALPCNFFRHRRGFLVFARLQFGIDES